MLARLSIAWKLMIAAGCAIGALLLLAAALVATNASGMVRNLSNDNAEALAGKAAAQVATDLGQIQGIGSAMALTVGADIPPALSRTLVNLSSSNFAG